MRRLRNFTLSFIVMTLFSISFISCLFNLETEETGIVSGIVKDDAAIALNQADGTRRTATTSTENPTYIFKEVPVGKTTIDITNKDTTTSQVIQVVAHKTTRVNPFGSTQRMHNSLSVNVYEMPVDSTSIEELTWEALGDEFYSKEINIPARIFSEGFPGVTDRFEWFAVVYEGWIVAPVTGTYKFKILCDDGALLFIDGDVVLNGDGIHPPATYMSDSISLEEGEMYDFALEYFQGPRYHIALVLEVQIPGKEMKLFNMDDFAMTDDYK